MTTEHRLEKLERENRWMRRIGMTAAAVAAVLFLAGQGKKDLPDLVVRSLTVKDEAGKVRAKLTTVSGATGLALMAENGKVRANLYTTPGGSSYLRFFDKDEKMRAELTLRTPVNVMGATGRPSLSIMDKAGRTRALLGTMPDGSAHLSLLAANGLRTWNTPP